MEFNIEKVERMHCVRTNKVKIFTTNVSTEEQNLGAQILDEG